MWHCHLSLCCYLLCTMCYTKVIFRIPGTWIIWIIVNYFFLVMFTASVCQASVDSKDSRTGKNRNVLNNVEYNVLVNPTENSFRISISKIQVSGAPMRGHCSALHISLHSFYMYILETRDNCKLFWFLNLLKNSCCRQYNPVQISLVRPYGGPELDTLCTFVF